jgi:hypothetical protein
MASLITMSEFQLYTQSSLSVSSTKLELASQAVVDYCECDFELQTVTREKKRSAMTADQDLWVDFYVKPVVTVSRIALAWGSNTDNETELSLNNMDLFAVEGYALIPFANVRACTSRIAKASMGVGFLTLGDEYITVVNYTGGVTAPLKVKEAVALLALEDHLVKEKWATGDMSGGIVKSYSVGSYSQTIGSPYTGSVKLLGTLGHGTPISEAAEKALIEAGYVKGGMVGVV